MTGSKYGNAWKNGKAREKNVHDFVGLFMVFMQIKHENHVISFIDKWRSSRLFNKNFRELDKIAR